MALYHELHWVAADVHNTFQQSHFCMLRFRLCSHHTLSIFPFIPSSSQNDELEGGPPCGSMPLGARLGVLYHI